MSLCSRSRAFTFTKKVEILMLPVFRAIAATATVSTADTAASAEAIAEIDTALFLKRDGLRAMRLVRDAQRATPQCPHLGVRLLESCLLENQLLCAAHGARTVLRYGMHDDQDAVPQTNSSLCRFIGSGKAFGTRAAKLRFCPAFGEPCIRLTNRSSSQMPSAPTPGTAASWDDGQLWSAENLVSWLKETLAHEDQWAARKSERHDLASMRRNLNHATLHHVQGNAEIAMGLYRKVIDDRDHETAATAAAASNPAADHRATAGALRAHAHSNLAWLELAHAKPRARANLEAALSLAPSAPEAAERWLSLATLHWLHSQPKLARHSLRKALALQPDAPFAHALRCELSTLRRDYVEAAAAARRADDLHTAAAPQLPRCVRWPSLLPRLSSLWGEPPPPIGSPTRYRELLLGCGASHEKLTGGGWHDGLERRGGYHKDKEVEKEEEEGVWRLMDADASFDEVHLCDEVLAPAASNPSSIRMIAEEIWRVLSPGGLLQVRARSAEAALLPSMVVVEGGSARQQALFEQLLPLASAEYVAFQKVYG